MPSHKGSSTLHGFVIGSVNYGEADVIVTIYTKERGKVTALAKGSRKLSSRKRSALLLFNKVSFEFVDTKGMGIIREAKLINSYDDARFDLRKVSLGFFFCEVAKKITPEHEVQTEIYELLGKAFARLEKTKKLRFLKNAFTKHILEFSGFAVNDKTDPLILLNEVLERELGSVRIGRMLQ